MLMAILLLLIRGLVMGYAARRVSELRADRDGFWWGFLLGTIGLLIVLFRAAPAETVPPSQPGGIRHSWLCSRCGARNPSGLTRCQSCRHECSNPAEKKACPDCGAQNKAGNKSCFACGRTFEN